MLEIAFLLSVLSPPQEEPRALLRERLEAEVRRLAGSVDGVVGVAVRDLETGDSFSISGDTVFTQASAIKLPLLVELFRQVEKGDHDLDEVVTLQAGDITPGSGVLQQLTPGKVSLTLRDIATVMITVSDNTATNMIIDRVGMENVNRTMTELGLDRTKLQRRMMDTEAWLADRENLSTPNEQARLLTMLHEGEVLSPESREELWRILTIPKSSTIRALLPDGTRVAHKTGSVPGVVVDVGIVQLEDRPFVIAVMANWLLEDDVAVPVLSEIALEVYRYFDRLSRSNSYGHRR